MNEDQYTTTCEWCGGGPEDTNPVFAWGTRGLRMHAPCKYDCDLMLEADGIADRYRDAVESHSTWKKMRFLIIAARLLLLSPVDKTDRQCERSVIIAARRVFSGLRAGRRHEGQ